MRIYSVFPNFACRTLRCTQHYLFGLREGSDIRLSPSGLDSLASQTESGTVKSGLGAILAPSDLTAACNLLKLKIHLKP